MDAPPIISLGRDGELEIGIDTRHGARHAIARHATPRHAVAPHAPNYRGRIAAVKHVGAIRRGAPGLESNRAAV